MKSDKTPPVSPSPPIWSVPNNGMIRPHHSKLALLFKMMDGIWIVASFWLLSVLYTVPWTRHHSVTAVFALITFYHFAEVKVLYRSWRSTSFIPEIIQVNIIWLKVILGLLLLAFVTQTPTDHLDKLFLTWFLIVPPVLIIWHILVRQMLRLLRQRGYNTRRAAIVGTGDVAMNLAHNILATPWFGIRLIGFYSENAIGYDPTTPTGVEVEGNCDDLVKDAYDGAIDLIYMALPMRYEAQMQELTAKLADTTVSLYMVPDVFASDLLRANWTSVAGMPVVSIFESPFYGVSEWVKRAEDIVLGSLILPVIAIPMLLIAIGVKLSSPGPVIFKQHRYGLDGRKIIIWKFRTMTVAEDGPEISQATKGDARVTRFGGFLRRSSLDELPQFINVLQGRMSIVGPRPHAVSHNELYRKQISGYMLRHKVNPGITGWAQVNGWRGETDTVEKMQKRVEHDLYYINNWSLWFDLKIILLTVVKGSARKNAY